MLLSLFLTAAELFINDPIDANNEWTENGISYDKNSNILTLNRTSLSAGDVKSHQFSCSGNQRIKETTTDSEYAYDANGNITHDAANGLEISYNLLNLPTRLFCWGDYAEYYDYLADGTKVRHAYQDGQERIYAGSLVYDQGVFESAAFGGGRIVGTYDDSEAHYFLTDHLGSTRVVARVTPAGREDLDRKDYYPFGKAWTQAGMPMSENRYTFSGKEQVDVAIEDGITTPIHDFGARYYDSDGVLFFQQDPLMEKYYSIGQYNYCAGNPVKYIDPNGLLVDDYFNHDGQYLGTDNASTDFVQIIDQDDWDANATDGVIDHDKGSALSSNITETVLSDKAVSNVVNHYNEQLNSSDGVIDVKVKTGQIDATMQHESAKGFSIGPVSVTTQKAVIRTNVVNGKIDPSLNTASNLTNALVHERDHHSFKGSIYPSDRELHAIETQKEHPSYKKTTKEFKERLNYYEKSFKNR